ncbi:MAG TPA: histidinol-phosphate transaminase [Verrucomicrobiae bacterium]|nr:histidinol-phosphate transaminase [Verrucomicrobiae bacterium]
MSVEARSYVKNLEVYVPGKPIEEVQRELGLTRVIKLASNENPWGPSPKALEAAKGSLERVFLYPDANAFSLKNLLAKELGIDENQLVTGNGSDEIVQMVAQAFVDPGDEVIMANPSFPRYRTVTELMGGVPVEVELHDYRHDLAAMAEKINSKTKVIFVCNPNNPTGTLVSGIELDEFMAKVPEHILVVFDEAYFEYVDDETYVSGQKYLNQGRQVLILRTFSKAFGLAGLRIGYGFANAEIIDLLNRVRGPFNGNLVALEAACAAWQDKEYLRQMVEKNAQGLEQLREGLERLGCKVVPSATNFVLAEVGKPSQEVFQALMRQGIIVRPGHLFGYGTGLRISVGTPEQNEEFLRALEAVL